MQDSNQTHKKSCGLKTIDGRAYCGVCDHTWPFLTEAASDSWRKPAEWRPSNCVG